MTQVQHIALVTGASRGIGRAIMLQLAKNGITVVGTSTTDAGANQISELLKEHSLSGCGMVLDVREAPAILELIETIKHRFGAVSILVNNAGITKDMLSMRMRDEDWQDVIDTNLSATFRLARAVMRDMMKARFGRIINIGSVVGATGNPGQANYAAAKAGLIGMSKSLARELGSRGITVNCVAPGFIETDMTHVLDDSQQKALLSAIPLGKLGKPEDVAHAVAFLASPEANYITGATIHVNGGMAMD
ncbi:MAG: 3-oxoacyl-[acyl-carrier-protein] reductase [Ferrovum sp. 37-45-19]|uniref:3-oxoacyl-ACP reductase FabG n=1 Tax=Ferrovum sp. JA12 TaxID=1356299 RepID=UPI00070352B6|nr:3-oxoacyl-ACP reductase FabG [Ferrovum sp. JA12]OYV80340.1 MAG: 3-oxoacyl-[acyl-carrier-protein] reductase [Ferrovum sp. 21-44-67]OYV95084.1 MAG: 3-oxoacyl-[acyl-carrier-protein] reductase [Ferrovum sp. 37-45-19]OZB31809.1 MAG: 3-oxoacyl-[acyl-carrier-protein] reductase [Ferrovum sp. 34-44-207]HQT80852.1 3-oxoacyl-ACP reductase FabG [Ferrovaceae bacterium]KRH78693.1 3-oxoacyl-[acyl-carrier-protein] reductase FabG [Ferrovum sp. JA12]